jgi:hypothetical protein
MSISFSCPECEARMEVPDEHAGLSGQCPRCKRVFTIPTSNAPPVRRATPVKPPPVPDAERDISRPSKNRRPRREPIPPTPRGPVWPWLVGLPAVLLVSGLLFSSLMVLGFHRRSAPPRPAIAALSTNASPIGNIVSVGKLDGNRVQLEGGSFAMQSLLTPADPLDGRWNGSRSKTFLVELRPGRHYVITLKSTQFSPLIIFNDPAGIHIRNEGNAGMNTARLEFQPRDAGMFILTASAVNRGVGLFSLTITEDEPNAKQ